MKVKLLVDHKVIIETLNRMGIFNKNTKTLYPSCYLFDNDGWEILHFKELLMTSDTGYNNFTEDDQNRKNAIIFNLQNWGLISTKENLEPHNRYIYVLRHEDKPFCRIYHKINCYKY